MFCIFVIQNNNKTIKKNRIMKTVELTTKNVMDLLEYFQDTAFIDWEAIASKDNTPDENLGAYLKAVEIANQELVGIDYELVEVKGCSSYCSAIWHWNKVYSKQSNN